MSTAERRDAAAAARSPDDGGIALRLGVRGRWDTAAPLPPAGFGRLFADVRRSLRWTRIELICGLAEPEDVPLLDVASAAGLPLRVILPESPEAFVARCRPADAERLRGTTGVVAAAPGESAGDDPRARIGRALEHCDLVWIVGEEFPVDPGQDARTPFALTQLVRRKDGGWEERNWFPGGQDLDGFATWLSRIDAFNEEAHLLPGGRLPAAAATLAAAAGAPGPTPEAAAGDTFRAADRLAIRLRNRTSRVVVGLLGAAYLAAVLFQVHVRLRYLHGGTPVAERVWFLRPLLTLQGADPPRVYLWWEDVPYLLIVSGIIAAYLLVLRLGLQRRHLEYRLLAECLRVQGAWRLAGVTDKVAWHVPFATDGELAWLGTALDHGADTAATPEPAADGDARRRFVAGWLDGQRRYHEARARSTGAVAAWIRRTGQVTLIAGVLLLYVRAIAPPDHLATIGLWLVVAAGAIVALWGRVTAVHDHARLHARSAATFAAGCRMLDEAARAGHPANATGLALRLGCEALAEHAFWMRLHKERPIELPRV